MRSKLTASGRRSPKLARTGPVWVIATLRSDLMSLLEDSPVLSNLARNDRLYHLERPRPGAPGEIIRRPAELAGLNYVGHETMRR